MLVLVVLELKYVFPFRLHWKTSLVFMPFCCVAMDGTHFNMPALGQTSIWKYGKEFNNHERQK